MTDASMPLQDLAGQRVLIIGGSSRMGLATARLAAVRGAEVILSSRNAQKLANAAHSIGGKVRTVTADATDPKQVERLLRDLTPLDHLVVTASASGSAGDLPGTSPEMARTPFERFWISYHAVHFAPQFVKLDGSLTLISGSSGRRPGVGYGFWSTLHSAIEGLSRAAALELAPIRVNTVSPGGVGIRPDRQLAEHQGQPEDVAAMILAVMTNPAVTNTIIDVDGGERLGTWSGR